MLLYWKNVDSNGHWATIGNWFEDAAASVPHGALPGFGDSCTLADGQVYSPDLRDLFVDLGVGVCDIPGILNTSTIEGGQFTGGGFENDGTISGGVFSGPNNSNNAGTITGGVFSGSYFTNTAGEISGGIFSGVGFDNFGTISGGVFSGSGFSNNGTISGGVWLQSGYVVVDGTPVTGSGDSNPGYFKTLLGGLDPAHLPAGHFDLPSATFLGERHMSTLNINISASPGGVSVQGNLTPTANGQIGENCPLAAAQAGALSTRTSDTAGVITATATPVPTTGDPVDVYWAGGMRAGMTATVAGNAVTLSGGVGDVLPAALTAVTFQKPKTVSLVDIDGDDLQLLTASATTRSAVLFRDDTGTAIGTPIGIAAGGVIMPVCRGLGPANPLAGTSLGDCRISNGDAAQTGNVNLGGMYLNGTE